ncbi:hypothetical protein ACFY04_20855 [Streptomyces sp. NPDC001549]|uniref:hypothetical protein n=1 Tax=Streptomyces sp. NPDC001549 TaxID=3364586 RepID=UPI00369C5047
MTANEAFEIHDAMRQYGITGTVTPADPEDPEGAWVVVGADGRDVTAHVLARVSAMDRTRPGRGFVVAR